MKDYSKYFKGPSLKDARSRGRTEVQHLDDAFEIPADMVGIGKGQTYYIQTYGCQANERDTETLSGILEMMGYTHTDEVKQADVVLLNTCAIRENAEEKVFGKIGYLKNIKKTRPNLIFGVCGCMAQEEVVVNKILEKFPQVDLIFGTHNIHRLPVLLKQAMLEKELVLEVWSKEGDVIENLPSHRANNYKAWVNIMYGCNKFCTYCIVPYTRGKERSRRMSDIIREVKQLIQNGGKEVILLGQNVNAYGKDLGMDDGFTDLLIAVAETGIERIRFYSSSPRDYSESTIQAMLDHPNIMPALHLPVQSGSNEVLRRMARGYTVEQYKEVFDRLKSKIPNITFTTDLIVGFPQETDEEFRDTIALVDYCKFDGAFSFMYSPREGTPAARMDGQIDAAVKKERLHELNEHINHWAKENNQKYLHKTVKVLCEGRSKKNAAVYSGYSEENKLVNFTGHEGLENQIVEVEITEVRSFSLNGKAL